MDNGIISHIFLLYGKKERQHTSTKKAVDRNDLSTKSVTARATTFTEILAIDLGTES